MSYSIYSDTFPIDESLCKDCKYRFSRTILPSDYERYGIDINEIEVPENEDLFVEQHICLVAQDDIDGFVIECNSYCPKNDLGFFSKNPY